MTRDQLHKDHYTAKLLKDRPDLAAQLEQDPEMVVVLTQPNFYGDYAVMELDGDDLRDYRARQAS